MGAYRPMWHCAAAGCERSIDDDYLQRISPKGKGRPFVGLCSACFTRRRRVLLKEAAAALLEDARRR
jgi:hypothetical protein